MKGLVGGPLLVGAWGPGPLGPPLNPALPRKGRNIVCRTMSTWVGQYARQ